MAAIRFVLLLLFPLIASCSRNDASLDLYFTELKAGKGGQFPYRISSKDIICVLQAYQSRLMPGLNGFRAEELNRCLSGLDIGCVEGEWILVRFSDGDISAWSVDRYRNPLSSPVDSDHDQWKADNGAVSAECASGADVGFSVFINESTGEQRVGMASTAGGDFSMADTFMVNEQVLTDRGLGARIINSNGLCSDSFKAIEKKSPYTAPLEAHSMRWHSPECEGAL